MRRDPQRRATDFASGQAGVLLAHQLPLVGISPDAAERAVGKGDWQRPARGVYLPHNRPLTPLQLGQAAAAYVRGPHVVTGLIPLHALGLRWLPPVKAAHVLVPDRLRRPSSGSVDITRTTGWGEIETWTRAGLRLACAQRAVVDASRALTCLREVRGIVLGAVADRHASPDELRRILDSGQRNGSANTRRAITDADRGCASPPEAELVDALVGRGVPFLVNPEVWVDGVRLGYADIWIVGTAVGGEVDSVERHEGEAQVESTYDRHERYVAAGTDLVHVSVRRVRRDAGEAATHLLTRAAAGPAVPRGLVVVPRGPLLR